MPFVTADSAEPKSIAELQRNKVNVKGAKKGKDSIDFGILWLQQHTIIVDVSCINLQNELRQYKWKEDKDGNVMRIPVDKFNHGIDDLRYAFEDDMLAAQLDWSEAGAEHIDEYQNRWQ